MKIRNFIQFLIVSGMAVMLSGCESGDSNPADGHDFGDNDPNLYAAIGDSITYGWGATTTYPSILSSILGKTVINKGVPGAESPEGVSMARTVLANNKPGYLLILYGANDAITGYNLDQTVENLRAIIQAAKANKTIPIIGTVTPMYTEHIIFDGGTDYINERLIPMAKAEGAIVADLHAAFGTNVQYMQGDGLHPNDEGLRIIANTFADAL